MTNFLQNEGHKILLAFWMTLKVSALSAAGSLVVGTVLAAMRVAPLPILRAVGTLYVNTLRNTPLTLIILFCGLGLGSIMTIATVQTTNYFWLAVLGLVAYTSAFVSRQRPDRPDQEHHDRRGDRRSRGLLHDAQRTPKLRRHRDPDLRRVRPLLRCTHPADRPDLRLDG